MVWLSVIAAGHWLSITVAACWQVMLVTAGGEPLDASAQLWVITVGLPSASRTDQRFGEFSMQSIEMLLAMMSSAMQSWI